MGPETTSRNEVGAGDGKRPIVVLTIAGFDPSSGAGVTADLQVFAAHGLFGVSAITSLTMQSTLGVAEVQAVDGAWVRRTLEHLTEDLPVAGIKIGMLGSEAVVGVVAEFLRNLLGQRGAVVPVVLDPVLRSSSGHELLGESAVEVLQAELLPLVGWVTPNWAELAVLSGRDVGDLGQAGEAAAELGRRYLRFQDEGLRVVATGGDRAEPVDLLWTADGGVREFRGERVETRSTHGTGCAFSSALLTRLVLGDDPVEAVAAAKEYVAEAMRSAPEVGHGRGPLDLLWPLRRREQGR